MSSPTEPGFDARPTSDFQFSGNLDATTPIGQSVNTNVTAYDSLGVANTIAVSFTKVAANTWAVTDSATSPAGAAFGADPLGAGSSITGAPNDLRPGSWAISLTAGGSISATFTPASFTPPSTFAAGAVAEPTITGVVAAGGTNTTLIPGLTITGPTALAAVGPIAFDVGITNQATAVDFTSGGTSLPIRS